MKLAVLYACSDNYIPYAIVGLKCFVKKNPAYNMFVIGTKFSADSLRLCAEYQVQAIEIDLTSDFINLDQRPYGLQYPIECFYHFYAYKHHLLSSYDFIVYSEADVYTNRPLDIDLALVTHIAGSCVPEMLLSTFPSLAKDLGRISTLWPTALKGSKERRMCPGLRIYNVKGLESISFYERIVRLYQNSWTIGAPRCGDDSLMGLYQMIYPTDILLLDPSYCIVYPDSYMTEITDVRMFHNHSDKYWQIEGPTTTIVSNIYDYFRHKHIEFIYNNFDPEFIRQYIPSIFVDVADVKIKFYYFPVDTNFGDLITPYFLSKCCENYDFEFDDVDAPKVISCGSIMRLAHSKTFVYGSGIRDCDQLVDKCRCLVVRGPRTRRRLMELGTFCPPIYGDPGLLLPSYYNPSISKQYVLGLIPHIIHYERIAHSYANISTVLVINLANPNVESVIDQILSCKSTISSSLHGLIVSDAYGIPNKWIEYGVKVKGDGTKFYDYFESVNRADQIPIDCTDNRFIPVTDLVKSIKPVQIQFDLDSLADNMFFDQTGIKNYTKYLIATENLSIIKSNMWFAFKAHWDVDSDVMTAVQPTHLKKDRASSPTLAVDMKRFVPSGQSVLLAKITDIDRTHYLIEERTEQN